VQVTRDEEVGQARLRVGQQTAILLELGRARPGCTQLLALGDDAADLGDERLDGVVVGTHGHQGTVVGGCQ
jgi:hypothetical protein